MHFLNLRKSAKSADTPSSVVQYYALVLKALSTEIEDQRHFKASCFEIVNDLRAFHACDLTQRLNLYDHAAEADKIGAVPAIEQSTLIADIQRYFRIERYC